MATKPTLKSVKMLHPHGLARRPAMTTTPSHLDYPVFFSKPERELKLGAGHPTILAQAVRELVASAPWEHTANLWTGVSAGSEIDANLRRRSACKLTKTVATPAVVAQTALSAVSPTAESAVLTDPGRVPLSKHPPVHDHTPRSLVPQARDETAGWVACATSWRAGVNHLKHYGHWEFGELTKVSLNEPELAPKV